VGLLLLVEEVDHGFQLLADHGELRARVVEGLELRLGAVEHAGEDLVHRAFAGGDGAVVHLDDLAFGVQLEILAEQGARARVVDLHRGRSEHFQRVVVVAPEIRFAGNLDRAVADDVRVALGVVGHAVESGILLLERLAELNDLFFQRMGSADEQFALLEVRESHDERENAEKQDEDGQNFE